MADVPGAPGGGDVNGNDFGFGGGQRPGGGFGDGQVPGGGFGDGTGRVGHPPIIPPPDGDKADQPITLPIFGQQPPAPEPPPEPSPNKPAGAGPGEFGPPAPPGGPGGIPGPPAPPAPPGITANFNFPKDAIVFIDINISVKGVGAKLNVRGKPPPNAVTSVKLKLL